MALLDKLFGRPKAPAKKSSQFPAQANAREPQNVVQEVARRIAQVFSSTQYLHFFGDKTFSAGWTYNDALAVWFSLGNLALVIAVWQEQKTGVEFANRAIDLVRAELLKQWRMPDLVFAKLQAALAETEEQAFKAFTTCTTGIELELFFSRYVSWILGYPVPFSGVSRFEDEVMGIRNQGTDIFQNAALSEVFVSLLVEIKQYLAKDNSLKLRASEEN
jgi:hypothetical protein